MNPQQAKLARALVIGALASVSLSAAWAEGSQTSAVRPEHGRERMEELCKSDPQKCEAIKKRIEDERAACKADPEACKQKREAMRDEMKKRFEDRCAAEPEKCEEMKQRLHERLHEKGGQKDAPRRGASPDPI